MNIARFAGKYAMPIAAGLFAATAFAHPTLLSSEPADKSLVDAPPAISLKFSETLVPQFSAASLVMSDISDMPGMPNHGAMKINAGVSRGSDGKTMIITPTQPLQAGSYRVDWRAVSSDTHPITGSITFQVK